MLLLAERATGSVGGVFLLHFLLSESEFREFYNFQNYFRLKQLTIQYLILDTHYLILSTTDGEKNSSVATPPKQISKTLIDIIL